MRLVNSSTELKSTAVNAKLGMDAWFTPARFALLLVVLICVAFYKVVLGLETFFFRDYGVFGYPLAHHYRESFWRGELPLWNPLNNCGVPFLAQWNTLVLYPPSLIYLLLPLPWSLNVFCLAHLFFAGLGMYSLAHRWTGSRFGAAMAGLAYAFNGLMLNSLMWPNNIAALGWMPWVVFSVTRAWQDGGRRVVVAALAGAMQMLAGAPEIILLTWLLLGLLWLSELDQGRVGARFARLLCVIVLVAGLTAAQLLPFFELLKSSERDSGFGGSLWAMPQWGWANFFVPLFRTHLATGAYFQFGQQWTSSYYVCAGVLALAGFVLLRVREGNVWLLGGVAAASLLLSMGDAGQLYAWLRKITPAIGFVRFPIKLVVLPVFIVPLLAAFAVRHFQDVSDENRRRSARTLGIVALMALVAIGGICWFSRAHPFQNEQWSVTAQNGCVRAIFLTLILGSFFALYRVQRAAARLLLAIGALLLVSADGLTHVPGLNPTTTPNVLIPGVAALRSASAPGLSRVMLDRTAYLRLYLALWEQPTEAYRAVRFALWHNSNLIDAVPLLDGFYSLRLRKEWQVWSLFFNRGTNTLAPLQDFLSVSHTGSGTNSVEWTPRASHLPLATGGQQPVFADDATTLLGLVRDDFDPRRFVYLPVEAKSAITATNASSAKILSQKFSPHEIKVTLETKEPALVVIAQTHYSPWKASVDGKPVRLWNANLAFQALEVPANSREVKLVYDDRAFQVGAMISGGSLAVCIVGLAFARKLKARLPSA